MAGLHKAELSGVKRQEGAMARKPKSVTIPPALVEKLWQEIKASRDEAAEAVYIQRDENQFWSSAPRTSHQRL